jgi:MFS family permease
MNPQPETRTRSPLANATYRRLFGAQVVALAGTGLTTIALTLLAYDLAGDDAGAVVGVALTLKMVVYVFGAPVITGLAGRLPRRRLLVVLDVLRAGSVVGMLFVTEVWQVYVLIVLVNASSAGFTPTFQATIPDVLTDEPTYTRALSLSRIAYELEGLLSPTLAAALIAFVSYDGLFAANGVAFLCSAALVLSTRLPARRVSQTAESRWRQITFGTRRYLATRQLRGLLALNLAVAAASAMVIVNTVVYVRHAFGGDAGDVAWALGASGAAAMLAALLLPRLLDRLPDRPVILSGGLVGLALAAVVDGSTRCSECGSLSVSASRPCRYRSAASSPVRAVPRSGRRCSLPSSRSRTPAGSRPTRSPAYSAPCSASRRRQRSWRVSRPPRSWQQASRGAPTPPGASGRRALLRSAPDAARGLAN